MALHRQGWPMRRIARALGIHRQTVRGWVRSGRLPVWSHLARGSAVDAHAELLRQRWDDDCHNAAQLWPELQECGFRGTLRTVQRWVQSFRDAEPNHIRCHSNDKSVEVASKRRAAWLVVADRDRLGDTEQRFVRTLTERSPELAVSSAWRASSAPWCVISTLIC
jgi:hypothetical protein